MTEQRDRTQRRRLDEAKAAGERWRKRKPARRDSRARAARTGERDTPERVLRFAVREASRDRASPTLRRVVREALSNTELPNAEKVAFIERQIGSSLDWTPEPSSAAAAAAGIAVARLCSTPDALQEAGFATGFMVSPRLLLTNWHVFHNADEARGTFAQFGYETRGGRVQRGLFYALDPEAFFKAEEQLDFALVAVRQASLEGRPLDHGFHGLLADEGKILIQHPITIIQHPDGATKRYAERENRLSDVLEWHLQYETDTAPGSSGSPCFNQAWEVVALHHSGVPAMSTDGAHLLKMDGKPWQEGRDAEEDIHWIANEGIRVSRIVGALKELRGGLDEAGRELLDEVFRAGSYENGRALAALSTKGTNGFGTHGPHATAMVPARPAARPRIREDLAPAPARPEVSPPQAMATVTQGNGDITICVHGPVTIQIVYDGAARPGAIHTVGESPVRAGLASDLAAEARIRFDTSYENRAGYDPDFLGENIPLPTIRPQRLHEMLTAVDDGPLILPYHHFSLALNAARRLQMWSAVNVDYTEDLRRHSRNREAFGSDTWIADPRVPLRFQITDDEFYKPATNIDRGHLVRRDDNAWGSTFRETEFANSDTFHWTNCSPQHERFNQSREPMRGLWGRLEDTIKSFAADGIEQSTIFAGPVLADDDPVAYGIAYPLRFWKVFVAFVDGRLEAYGFVLDQSPVVRRFGLEERLDFGRLRVHQSSIEQIEEMTGVELPDIVQEHDVLAAGDSIEVRRGARGLPEVRRPPAPPLRVVVPADHPAPSGGRRPEPSQQRG